MRYLIFLTAIIFILFLAGCSDKTSSPDLVENTVIEDQGIPAKVQKLLDKYIPPDEGTTGEEQPAFLDSIPTDLIDNCDIYSVTFLWGDLFNIAPPSADTTDWSGTLSVNGEAVVHVRYAIDFEPGQDSVIIHNNPSFAIWISYTSQDFDGLSFLVFLKRNVEYFVAPKLTFETKPIILRFNFYQLACLDAFYQVDNLNGVVVHARRIWHNTCPGGLIEGRWIKDGYLSSSGHFKGYWMNHLGDPIGYLNGIFWGNNDGAGRFSGSVSGLYTDEVIAELKGIWYYDDPRMCPICGEGHGVFRGVFRYLNCGRAGILEGEFGGYSLSPDQQDMPMIGIWRFNCPWNVNTTNSQ